MRDLARREDIGALRLRTIAAKDYACSDFPGHAGNTPLDPAVVLDLYWSVLVPRRVAVSAIGSGRASDQIPHRS